MIITYRRHGQNKSFDRFDSGFWDTFNEAKSLLAEVDANDA